MDEDIRIIDENTRNEKIKNLFKKNKIILSLIFAFFIILILSFFSYQSYKSAQKEQVSEKYNNAVIKFKNGEKSSTILLMTEVVKDRDETYSPLALYFLIDNDLVKNTEETNSLFDILITKTDLAAEIKNLIIYKKGLYNADLMDENELLDTLNPVINSNSVWKSHSLYLMAEYFYSKDQLLKSKEFFNQILNTENANSDIVKQAQKRLNRDLSD